MSTIVCAGCNKTIPAAEAVYSRKGEQICNDCSMAVSIRRNEAEGAAGKRGGLMDKAFLRKIRPDAHKWYWIGQVVMILLVFGVAFAGGLDLEEVYWAVILVGLAAAAVWGLICTKLFPFDPDAL